VNLCHLLNNLKIIYQEPNFNYWSIVEEYGEEDACQKRVEAVGRGRARRATAITPLLQQHKPAASTQEAHACARRDGAPGKKSKPLNLLHCRPQLI
jgi:hypothetical protein